MFVTPNRQILPGLRLIAAFTLTLGMVIAPALSVAQESAARVHVEEVLKGLDRSHGLGPVAISPDGTLLAFTHHAKDGWGVEVAPFSDPAKTTRVTAVKKADANCGEGMVKWAPDSRRLAFVGDCETRDQDNIYLATIGGDAAHGKAKVEVVRLTEAKGEVGFPEFSPDGLRIAFLYVPGATRQAGALAAMKPWAGVIGEDGVEIQRVGLIDSTGKKLVVPALATPANLHIYEFDWAPDSKSLAYVAADPPGENNWWVAKLYTQKLPTDKDLSAGTPVGAGGESKAILAPAEVSGALHGLQIAVPRWSPDGKQIAFIGGLMSDQGSTGGDVWLISATGGEPRDVTAERPTSPAWIAWQDDSQLYVSELAGGNSQLVRIDVASGKASEPVYSFEGTPGDGQYEMSLSTTKDRSIFVFNASSFGHPMEIFAAKTGGATVTELAGLRQLTHFNDGLQPVWSR